MGKTLILIAEDEAAYAKLLKQTLEKDGHSVAVVLNGDELVRVVHAVKSVVIVLDIIMPLKNGFQALTEIKSDKKLRKIPIIILSNVGQPEDIERAKKLGANEYLIKSDETFHDVVKRIKTHLI